MLQFCPARLLVPPMEGCFLPTCPPAPPACLCAAACCLLHVCCMPVLRMRRCACRTASRAPCPPANHAARGPARQAANLLLDETGTVKIADFGVARVMDHTGIMTAETGTYRWAGGAGASHMWSRAERMSGPWPRSSQQPPLVRASLRPEAPPTGVHVAGGWHQRSLSTTPMEKRRMYSGALQLGRACGGSLWCLSTTALRWPRKAAVRSEPGCQHASR